MKKEFTVNDDNGKEIKLVFRQANREDFNQADRAQAAKVAELVRDRGRRKLLLKSEVETFLKENNIWTDADQVKIEEIQSTIDTLLNKLRKGGEKISVGRKVCIEVADLRQQLMQKASKRQVLYDQTIEAIAEVEKVEYLIYTCTVYAEDGKNYWDSFEDMKNDQDSNVYKQASQYVYQVVFNLNPDFENRLPENRWLKKYNFIDDKFNFIDRKTGERVDRSGNPIEKIQEKAIQRIENLQGEISEEIPFIDDETNEPIILTI